MGVKSSSINFQGVKHIAIDSMCFIYHFEDNIRYADLIDEVFHHITSGKLPATTSVITITETLTTAEEEKVYDGIEKWYASRILAMDNLKVINVDIAIAAKAAGLRRVYRLKLGDAIQLATALLSKADLFLTNDQIFRRVKELKVAILDDYLG